jgi:hypothetical protein
MMTAMSHVKLFSTITDSSIWDQPDNVCKIWITMLAMADWHGCVFASLPGLANRARKTIPEVEKALEVFRAPDPYSRTQEHEGRRIVDIDGGWMLLNYCKHREARNAEALRESKRDYAARRRSESKKVEARRTESKPVEESRTESNESRKNDSVSVVSDLDLPDLDPEGVQGEDYATPPATPPPASEPEPEAQRVYEDEPQEGPSSDWDAIDVPARPVVLKAFPEDWVPSEALFVDASLVGLSREQVMDRLDSLRMGPIGGSRGIHAHKLDDWVRKLLPKWRQWFEIEAAKRASSVHAPPTKAQVAGMPPWVSAKHKTLADKLGVDLGKAVRAFRKHYHLPVDGLPANDVFAPFRDYLQQRGAGGA